MLNEASNLNQAIYDARNHEFWENPYLSSILEVFYGHTIPFAAFPQVEKCLGLKAKDSQMSIEEGMAVMSFNYTVKKSTTNCLFRMNESKFKEQQRKMEQEARKLERYHKTPIGWADKKINKLGRIIDDQVIQKIPPLSEIMEDPTVKRLQEMVQDEKVQQAVKDGLKTASQVGDRIGKQFEKKLLDLTNIGDALGSIFKPKNKAAAKFKINMDKKDDVL